MQDTTKLPGEHSAETIAFEAKLRRRTSADFFGEFIAEKERLIGKLRVDEFDVSDIKAEGFLLDAELIAPMTEVPEIECGKPYAEDRTACVVPEGIRYWIPGIPEDAPIHEWDGEKWVLVPDESEIVQK